MFYYCIIFICYATIIILLGVYFGSLAAILSILALFVLYCVIYYDTVHSAVYSSLVIIGHHSFYLTESSIYYLVPLIFSYKFSQYL